MSRIASHLRGIPWRCATASLKPNGHTPWSEAEISIPWRCATASLKHRYLRLRISRQRPYSVALCHGLIEASQGPGYRHYPARRIPWRCATASLKPLHVLDARGCPGSIPWRCATASLKPLLKTPSMTAAETYSVALCHGLIEATPGSTCSWPSMGSIPWRCATASLKRRRRLALRVPVAWYSVALCHGLIEARNRARDAAWAYSIPWRCATASLKRFVERDKGNPRTAYSVALCHGLIEAGQGRIGSRRQ